MALTLLHVEDDPLLAVMVRHAFEALGFTGEFLSAGRVADAVDLIARRKGEGGALDLILLDMRLPDGTGLDVLRSVKANPAWAATPVIFLSGERDPKTIAEAYALGANCFLSKFPKDTSILEAVKSLYDCWFKSALLPPGAPVDEVGNILARAVSLRSRVGDFCNRLARAFAGNPEVMGFWLDRALNEGNLANICAFLLSQSREVHADAVVTQRISAMQAETEQRLRAVEGRFQTRPTPGADEGYAWYLDVADAFDEEAFADGLALLFPIAPVAARALKARIAVQFRDIGTYVQANAVNPSLRKRAQVLLGIVERMQAAVAA